jgi:hypothetical protein
MPAHLSPQKAVIRFKTRPAECDLIISALSAVEAVAEAPLAALAVIFSSTVGAGFLGHRVEYGGIG